MIESIRAQFSQPGARPKGTPARPQVLEEPQDQVLLLSQKLARQVPVESAFGPPPETAPEPVSQPAQSPADPFRDKARAVVAQAREQISQTAWGSLFVEELEPLVVESTALNLFERSLGTRPEAPPQVALQFGSAGDAFTLHSLPVSDNARGLARQGQYLSFLSATSGAGALSPALLTILEDFNTDKLQQLARSPLGMVLAASTSSVPFVHEGVQVSGCRSQREKTNLTESLSYLKDRCPTALDSCKLVVLESALLPDGPETVTHGQVFVGQPTALLRRSVCDTPESTQWVLFHEIGHLMDNAQGYTQRSDSPFGKGQSVSSYAAEAGPQEDFAETHADVLKNWDQIKANPDLYVHASGETGQKRAWILENVYQQKVAPASESCRKFLALDHAEGPTFDRMPVLKTPGPAFQQFRALIVKRLQELPNSPEAPHSDDKAALDWARSYLG